jgi:carboxypeptidase C (cathepsin A)
LYVYGISYGGIYAPYLALAIHNHNQEVKLNQTTPHINLKGFIVANGATDWLTDPYINTVHTAFHHNLISPKSYAQWTENKCLRAWDGLRMNLPPKCMEVYDEIWQTFTYTDIYDM